MTLSSETTETTGEKRAGPIIREDDFRLLLEARVQPFFEILNLLRSDTEFDLSRRLVWKIREEAHGLETFLDDYGARHNRTFSYLTEVLSSVRSFARALFELLQIRERYDRYRLDDSAERREAIMRATTDVQVYCLGQLLALMTDAERNAIERIGLDITEAAADERDFRDRPSTQSLPNDVDESEALDDDQRMAEIASKYLRCVENWRAFEFRPIADPAALRRFVLSRYTEEHAAKAQGMIQSIQAKYDTYFSGTSAETPESLLLRGHISISLHLFAVAAHLVHFYERHENDIRFEAARERIATIVDKHGVLDRVVNYCLRYAGEYLIRGEKVARLLLERHMKEGEVTLSIPGKTVLHARPATLIVRIVHHYGTSVEMTIAGQSADARSITNVLLLVGTFPEARRVTFRGDEKPLADLKLLFESELGESKSGLPERLSYLLS